MGLLAKIFGRNKGCIRSRKSGATKREISSSDTEIQILNEPSGKKITRVYDYNSHLHELN